MKDFTHIDETGKATMVDVGAKQDGLVHISQLSNRFITDPNEAVKLGQKVMVTVTEVDIPRKRIALSMKDATPDIKNKRPEIRQQKTVLIKPEPMDDFQAKLLALKKSFR